VISLSSHLTQIRDLPVRENLAIGLRAIQKAGHAGSGKESVVLGFESSQLLAAHIGATTRHHHGGIPSQERK
jgi:hypothetical protein